MRYFVTKLVIYDLNWEKSEKVIWIENYLSTRYPVLKLFSRIACLIFVYICTRFYDGTYNLCTLCTRCQGLRRDQLGNIVQFTLNGWAGFYTIKNLEKEGAARNARSK